MKIHYAQASKNSFTQVAKSLRQAGGAMMTVIFVIVVMSILGITLTQIFWSNQQSQTRALLGTQAWFVAHSANDWALTKLYPLDQADDFASVKTRCENSSIQKDATLEKLEQLTQCNIDVSCSYNDSFDADDLEGFGSFELVSTVDCGGDDSAEYKVNRSQKLITKGISTI